MTGDVAFVAKAENSLLTQALGMERRYSPRSAGIPSRPNSDGIHTVNPFPTTTRAKSATLGVTPGISAMTITAGPEPAR